METSRPPGAEQVADLLALERHLLGDGLVEIEVRGEVDSASGPVLEDALMAEITDGLRRLSLDLDSVSFFSSAGISILIAVQRRCAARGATFVVRAPHEVRRVLDLVGVNKIVSVVDSGEAAAD